MVTFKLHKLVGIFVSFWLFNLALTGFLLNHEKNLLNFDFLWNINIPDRFFSKDALERHRFREVTSYKVHHKKHWEAIGSMRGFYVNKGNGFKKIFDGKVFKIEPYRDSNFRENFDVLYLATNKGIYKYTWIGVPIRLDLKEKNITSISINGNWIVFVKNKKDIYMYNLHTGNIMSIIPYVSEIPKNISLNRFVRDFHYGRGVFTNPFSAYMNDFFAIWMIIMIFSGFAILFIYKYLKIYKYKKGKNKLNFAIKLHSNKITLISIPFVFLLTITGIFIDHPKFFKPITNLKINTSIMPPAYHLPEKDIWDIDFDGKYIRIGTRIGIYKTNISKIQGNKLKFSLEKSVFAYKFIRNGKVLFLSGMGNPSFRLENGNWKMVNIHMPVDFVKGKPIKRNELPIFSNTLPLYAFLLTLHDGSFFDKNLIYLNDLSGFLVVVLLITGLIRYMKRKMYKNFV